MEVKKEQNDITKMVVPLKGDLLSKIRAKIEAKKKDSPVKPQDALNNNHNGQDMIPKKEKKEPEKKVIIQSIEKVQIDLTSMLPSNALLDHAGYMAPPLKVEPPQQERMAIKILTAKMPENECNKAIPLNMTRYIRAPKPVPILKRNRLGNVEVHQATTVPVVKKVPSEEFRGFSSNEKDPVLEQISFIRESLKMSKNQNTSDMSELPSTLTSQVITDSMVDSSMMREFASALEPTATSDEMDSDYDEMDESTDNDSEMDTNQADWLMDIEELLGEKRIREIDQSLKKIPSIATGNKIQTENVELKLIINHLLKKLNAQSVAETLKSVTTIQENIAPSETKQEIAQESIVSEVTIEETKQESDRVPIISEVSIQEPEISESEDHQDVYDVCDLNEESQIDIQDETVQETQPEIVEEASDEETPKEVHVESSRKRKNELFPLATSTAKKMKPNANYGAMNANFGGPSTSAQADDNSVISSRVRSRFKAENQNTNNVVQEIKRARGRPDRFRNVPTPSKVDVKQIVRRNSKIVSENDVLSEKSLCKNELKSDENDLNSPASAVIVYEHYLNSSSSSPPLDKREKAIIDEESNLILKKVQMVVERQKAVDKTFRKPKLLNKRPYLRTSAFKGNEIEIKQETLEEPCTNSNDSVEDSDSVSNDPQSPQPSEADINPNIDDKLSLKELMNSLIEGKERVVSKLSSRKPIVPRKKVKKKPKPKVSSRKPLTKKVHVPNSKKIFEQEPLETADENRVPYMQIIESIKISEPLRGKNSGKVLWKSREMSENDMMELREKLSCEKYFKCGTCMFLVTKHKWKEHLESHGMFSYIHDYETPLNIMDWNECLRRMIQYCRIYKIDTLYCPHCDSVKKSPLGHMSHVYVCGEDTEALEARKLTCEFCNARVLPFTMSAHKRSCKELKNVTKENEDESASENEDKEVTLSGRVKRKAVKKAEKNFISILKTLDDDIVEHVATTDENESQCNLCGEKFTTKELTIEHIENVHKKDDDFGSSSSDDYSEKSGDSSETDDESSGVDENEQNSENSVDDDEVDSKIVSFPIKGRKSVNETDESKRSREVLYDYIEQLRGTKLSSKIVELQKELKSITYHDEIFANLAPKYNFSSMDIATLLNELKFKDHSVNYTTKQVNQYLINFEDSHVEGDWKQLNVGTHDTSDSHHIIFYCGGSVSSTDWAPTNDKNSNFLAVACNGNHTALKFGLKQSIKSCVQIYEFNSLVNRGFQNFRNTTSHLLYLFNIDDGPIWSIKFHPCGHPTDSKIGILAVTTANQKVLIFSLPYLNENHGSPLVVTLEPNIVCKLSRESISYQDKLLLQTTRICWHYQKDSINTLAAGFVDGLIAFWNFDESSENAVIFPDMFIKAHSEAISVLDMKVGNRGEILLLTSSCGREVKLFSIENNQYKEIAITQPSSRTLCGLLWAHWPAFLIGNDSAYALGVLLSKQPFDFGTKNTIMIQLGPTINSMDVNHWTSTVICCTESGDLISATPHQLVKTDPKDRWTAFQTTILSFTDFKRVPQGKNKPDEIGIVFSDMKSNGTKKPKNFRTLPVELTNQLQINHICFNRNEKSHRFYALGYETGFVRIRFIKSS